MKESSIISTINNLSLPPIQVRHAGLIRFGESDFRSICPACGEQGLFMHRDHQSFQILVDDNCVCCGRRVKYTDIEPGKLMVVYKT